MFNLYSYTRFTQAQVVHVFREGNCCADALAKWGNNMLEGFVVFDRPPNDDFLYLSSRDKDGQFVNRVSAMDPNSTVRAITSASGKDSVYFTQKIYLFYFIPSLL